MIVGMHPLSHGHKASQRRFLLLKFGRGEKKMFVPLEGGAGNCLGPKIDRVGKRIREGKKNTQIF